MISKRLADHKIESIQPLIGESRYPRTIERNARRRFHGDGVKSRLLLIGTDQGASGWGLARVDEFDPNDVLGAKLDELFDPATGVTAAEASSLDFALHDLAGRILGLPVHAMLGGVGTARSSIACYDGAIYMDDLIPETAPAGIDAILAICRADYALGYRDFKLKIGRGYQWLSRGDGLERDIAVTRCVREAYPEARLLVDANDGLTPNEAVRFLEAVADCDIFWLEELFRESRDHLKQLKAAVAAVSPGTLIADGEAKPDPEFLLEMAAENLIDVLLPDVAGFGFTAWRRLMPLISQAGAQASPHCWGDPLKVVYAAHLAAGLGHVPIIEGVPFIKSTLDFGRFRMEGGMLHLPGSTPGFGVGLNLERTLSADFET